MPSHRCSTTSTALRRLLLPLVLSAAPALAQPARREARKTTSTGTGETARSSTRVRGIAGASAAAAERRIWRALAASDIPTLDALTGITYVDMNGIAEWTHAVSEQLRACTLRSYALRNVRERALGAGVVLVTYTATLDQTCGTQRLPSPVHVMSLWQHRGGRWIPLAHAESNAAGAR